MTQQPFYAIDFTKTVWNIMNVRTPFIGEAKRDHSKDTILDIHDEKLQFLIDFADFLDRWKIRGK